MPGTLHRIDEAYTVRDFEKRGFKLVGKSDLLRRPQDERTWCLTHRRVWARPTVLCSCFAKTPANIPGKPGLCRDVRVLHKKKFAGSAVALLALAAAFAAPTGWTAPLEVYGRLPSLENVALSPDGSRVALIRTIQNDRFLFVYSLAEHKLIGKTLRVGTTKLRSIAWPTTTT